MTKECPQTSVLRDDLISRAAALSLCDDYPYVEGVKMALQDLPQRTLTISHDPRDAVIAQLVDAAEAQLQYMDMCGDKGDLERNLRSALFAVKGLKNE